MRHDRNEYVMHNPRNRACCLRVAPPAPRLFPWLAIIRTAALVVAALALVRIAS